MQYPYYCPHCGARPAARSHSVLEPDGATEASYALFVRFDAEGPLMHVPVRKGTTEAQARRAARERYPHADTVHARPAWFWRIAHDV